MGANDIQGTLAPGAGAVPDAFARAFTELGETGAACAVWRGGEWVADLWAGEARPGVPWTRATLVGVYSSAKPFAALGLLRAIALGGAELDDPVTRHWPEYGAQGKERTTLRHLLTHRAGLMSLDPPLPGEALLDWDRVTAALAAAPPQWTPGEEQGEHAVFYGHLVGEVTRRVTGTAFSAWLRREVAEPWGLDLHAGLTAAEQARCATLSGMDDAWVGSLGVDPATPRGRALFAATGMLQPEVVNGAPWRGACVPAVNAHATARALAALLAGVMRGGEWNGVRLLPEPLARAMRSEQFRGRDHFVEDEVRWGLGVQLDFDGFGHGGLGGSLAWADPERDLAFAYVTARMGGHERAIGVWDAARAL